MSVNIHIELFSRVDLVGLSKKSVFSFLKIRLISFKMSSTAIREL